MSGRALLLLAPVLAYAAGTAAVARALRRPRPRPDPGPDLPPVAVLVAARDEEPRLPRCLDALLAQDYPPGLLTVYVADDHSTDGTAEVVRRYADRRGDPAVRYVPVPDPTPSLRGKALALHAAVEASSEPYLLVTDADCAPPPSWARTLVGYLRQEGVGVACGPTRVEAPSPGVPEALADLQALDWAYLLATCSVLAEAGRPVTAMGNNMGLRRAAYDAVGGYPALPFSVTEDYLLFKRIVEGTPWRARFPFDPALENVTLPLGELSEVYEQRRRWARGGLRARPWVYGAYALAHLAHLLPLPALARAPGPALGALALKVAADRALLRVALGPHRPLPLRALLRWEAYLHAYMATLPAAILLAPRIRWKGRRV